MKRATSNYLKRVSDVAKQGFSSQEEKESCINNVFAELEEEGMLICQCPETSVIVEQFVSLGTAQNLDVLFKVLHKDIVTVLKDKYASHVLESILLSSPKLIESQVLDFSVQNDDSGEDTEEGTKEFEKAEDSLINMIVDLSRVVLDDIEAYLTDSYSSHVLRALLQVLGGTSVDFKINRQKKGRAAGDLLLVLHQYLLVNTSGRVELATSDVYYEDSFTNYLIVQIPPCDFPLIHILRFKTEPQGPQFNDFDVPELFKSKIKTIGKHILKLGQVNVLLLDTHASAVIQILLLASHKVDLEMCQKFIKKLIKLTRISDEDSANNARLPPVATDKVGSFLVQQIMSLASPNVYSQLYSKLFKGNLLQFAIHPKANFVLQSLLGSCSEKAVFKEQFEELKDNFEDILAYGHYGVIIALVKSCQKLECKQKPFKQSLMSSLHCRDPQDRQKKLALMALTMRTYEVYYNLPENDDKPVKTETPEEIPDAVLSEKDVNYFGSLLLQEMLKFTGTKLIVASLLDMSSADLSSLLCNSFGSYVLETFFQSKNVDKTAKDSLIEVWKGKSIDIACHRIGCQSMQSLWKSLSLTQKASIAEELCKDEIKVRSDQYGKYVYSNMALQHFKKRPKDWEYVQQNEVKKRKLFHDMLGKDMSSKRHKKGSGTKSEQMDGANETEANMEFDDVDSNFQGRGGRGHRGRGDNQHGGFRGRGRGDDSRGGYRGRGDNQRGGYRGRGDNSRGGYRGRGDNFRGGYRGRGDNQGRGSYRGNSRGSTRGWGENSRGNYSNSFNNRDDNGDQGYDGGRERGQFRDRGSSRGWGDKRGRGRGGFVRDSGNDNEIGKSGSFGGDKQKNTEGRSLP